MKLQTYLEPLAALPHAATCQLDGVVCYGDSRRNLAMKPNAIGERVDI